MSSSQEAALKFLANLLLSFLPKKRARMKRPSTPKNLIEKERNIHSLISILSSSAKQTMQSLRQLRVSYRKGQLKPVKYQKIIKELGCKLKANEASSFGYHVSCKLLSGNTEPCTDIDDKSILWMVSCRRSSCFR